MFFAFSIISNAQIVNIPDANFKSILLSGNTFYGYVKDINGNTIILDNNFNGEIEVSEALAAYEINIPQNNNLPKVNSVEGISSFMNLNSINISQQNILTVDLSQLNNLKEVSITNSNVESINLNNLINLEFLRLNNNKIESLNLSALLSLKYLECSANLLNDLDLSSCFLLEDISCLHNNLTNINLDNLNLLTNLNLNNNQISDLDLTDLTSLVSLDAGFNLLTNIEFGSIQNIESLKVVDNLLSELDLTSLINLKELLINSNDFSIINVNNQENLNYLNLSNNPILSLDLSNNKLLSNLVCEYTLLSELDVSNQSVLYALNCTFNNNLSIINIKNGFPSHSSYYFSNIPNLEFVCVDEEAYWEVYTKIFYNSGNTGTSNLHLNAYCTFTPGGTFYEISGNTKFDFDNNGCDLGDLNLSNLNLSITDDTTIGAMITNSTGNYYIPVQSGIHTITPVLENPTYFNISPTNFTVDFPSQDSPFTQDFCVTANGVHSDVEVVVVPTIPARPGFDASYRIIYKNIGNQVENGEVDFAYQEDVLDFISSSTVYNSQNVYGNTTTLSWNYNNLMPFETRTIDVVLNVNSPTETPAVNNGDVLGIFSEISTTNTDEDLSNNSSGLRQVVVGSYDPNDKTCVEGEIVDVSVVGEYVHYIIRFENTGTYPAQNIVVKDMIDTSKFDISTLVPLHGSHEFFTRIKDNKVEFIFENISLDFNDATNDGYVAFKIKTLPSLTVGDTFSNDANIYFDYNFPITTNDYETTIQNLLSNQDFAFENEFILYPNPAKDILNISTKNQTEIQSVEIYNIVGQVVIAIPNSTTAIDVSNLETGTYFVKVNTEKGSTTTKFVKE